MEGKTITMGSTVELSVPALKEMMLVVRLTTAAVMARVGVDADKMDDMKMAVEEAANCLMQSGCIGTLKLSFVRVEDGVDIIVCAESEETGLNAERPGRSVSEDELAVIRCILETMADKVDLCHENGCIRSIRLTGKAPKD